MESKEFLIDVGNRLNSTNLLLESCEGYETLIIEFYNTKHRRNDGKSIFIDTVSRVLIC